MDHTHVAVEVIEHIGGKENVQSVTHCVTRLRFTLKESDKADSSAIKGIDGVVSVINQAGQFQVVIGNEVSDVYAEVEKLLDLSSKDVIKNESDTKSKFNLINAFTSLVSGIFMPLIGSLVAAGLLKGIITLIVQFGLIESTSNTYVLLDAISNAFFYFFPIFVGASAAKYLKLDIYLGMLIGAILVYPDLIAVSSSGQAFDFFKIPMNILDYSNSVFPVILAILLAAYVEKGLAKILPKGLKSYLGTIILLLIVLPLTFWIVGPVITKVSDVIAMASFAIFDISPVLAGLVIGGTWSLITMFGLHWAFMPIFLGNIITKGVDPMLGVLIAGAYATTGATLAIAVRGESKEVRSLALSTGITALIGVGEPALYGILLPRKKPFIISLISGGIGGAIGALMGTKVYTMAPFGLGTINPAGIDSSFYGMLVQIIVGFALAFGLTYVFGYKPPKEKIN